MTVEQDLQAAVAALNTTNQTVQTNLSTLTSATTSAAANAAQTAADRTAVAADKATVAADKATVAADKATVAADKATVATDRSAVSGLLNTFRSVMLGAFANDAAAAVFANANGITIADGVMYQNTVSDKFRIYNGTAWQDYDSSAAASTSAAAVSAAAAAASEGAALTHRNAAEAAASNAASVATAAATTTATTIANNAVATTLQNVSNITTLRTIAVSTTRGINLMGYYAAGDGGGGRFYGVTGASAGTYVDNGGTIIVPTGGNGSAAWIREEGLSVDAKWFGAKGDGVTDDQPAFSAAIDYLRANNLSNLTAFNDVFYFENPVKVLSDTTFNLRLIGNSMAAFNTVRPGGTRITGSSASFTASILDDTLTVSAVAAGAIKVGHKFRYGDTFESIITALGTGTGGVGTYKIATATFKGAITGNTLTVTQDATLNGAIKLGDAISATGLAAGTTVTAFGANTTGGVGTYTLSASAASPIAATAMSSYTPQTVASVGMDGGIELFVFDKSSYSNTFSGTISGSGATRTLTLNSDNFGIFVGMTMSWSGLTAGTVVTLGALQSGTFGASGSQYTITTSNTNIINPTPPTTITGIGSSGGYYSFQADNIDFFGANGVYSAISNYSSAPNRTFNIYGCTFTYFQKGIVSDLRKTPNQSTGISVVNIRGNTMIGNRRAIWAAGDAAIQNCVIVGNQIEQNWYGGIIGVENGFGSSICITDNLLEGQQDPINISVSYGVGTIARNYFESNKGYLIKISATNSGSEFNIGLNFIWACGGTEVSLNGGIYRVTDNFEQFGVKLDINVTRATSFIDNSDVIYPENWNRTFALDANAITVGTSNAVPSDISGSVWHKYSPPTNYEQTPLGLTGYSRIDASSVIGNGPLLGLGLFPAEVDAGDALVAVSLARVVSGSPNVSNYVYNHSTVAGNGTSASNGQIGQSPNTVLANKPGEWFALVSSAQITAPSRNGTRFGDGSMRPLSSLQVPRYRYVVSAGTGILDVSPAFVHRIPAGRLVTFTGQIDDGVTAGTTGNVLTVTALTATGMTVGAGKLVPGQKIYAKSAGNLPEGLSIVSQLPLGAGEVTGGVGRYTVSALVTSGAASGEMYVPASLTGDFYATVSGTTLTTAGAVTGNIVPGQKVYHPLIPSGLTVMEQLSTTESSGVLGGRGTYRLSASATVANTSYAFIARRPLNLYLPYNGPLYGVSATTVTPGTIGSTGNTTVTTTVTVTGAALGDRVESVSFSQDLLGVTLSGYVSAANTVTVVFTNNTGSDKTLSTAGSVRVVVGKLT